MKKLSLSIRIPLIALFLFSILTGISIADDLQTGFGGIEWSTALDLVKDCDKIEEREGIQYCFRRDQTHTLLGEPAPGALYGFYQSTFFAVFPGKIEDESEAVGILQF